MNFRRFLKSKLHMLTVTEANLAYEGSITIDEDIMDMVGIVPYEFLLISNVNNGERFETYVIPGPRGSRVVCLNGATARKGLTGDRIIVFSLTFVPEDELHQHKPRIIVFGPGNIPQKTL